jgi:hypothetical protein
MNINTDNLLTIKNYAKSKDISVTYVKKLAEQKKGVTIVVIDGFLFVDVSKSTFEGKTR